MKFPRNVIDHLAVKQKRATVQDTAAHLSQIDKITRPHIHAAQS